MRDSLPPCDALRALCGLCVSTQPWRRTSKHTHTPTHTKANGMALTHIHRLCGWLAGNPGVALLQKKAIRPPCVAYALLFGKRESRKWGGGGRGGGGGGGGRAGGQGRRGERASDKLQQRRSKPGRRRVSLDKASIPLGYSLAGGGGGGGGARGALVVLWWCSRVASSPCRPFIFPL